MIPGFGKARAAHLRLGRAGEDAAVRMFQNLDCDVLLRDYRVPKGEIDLVVRDGLSLIFAEVKTRRAGTAAEAETLRPADSLRLAQKRRIYRAAFTYLREIGRPAVPYRFDLVEVVFLGRRLYAMRHGKAHFGVRDMDKRSRRVNLFR